MDLVETLGQIQTSYDFVEWAKVVLTKAGYTEIKETDEWTEIPDMFFVTRANSSIIAINKTDLSSGIIYESSSGVPALKLTDSFTQTANCEQCPIKESGDSTTWSWLDRDLTIAGAVVVKDREELTVVRMQDAVAIIPSLAVHLAPGSGTKGTIDTKQLTPVFKLADSTETSTLMDILSKQIGCDPKDILNYDLSLVPTDPVELVGIDKSILAGYGLDGKLGSVLGLEAFIAAGKPQTGFNCVSIGNAVFSSTPNPNVADFLASVLARIGCTVDTYLKSFMISNHNFTTGMASPDAQESGVYYERGLRESYQVDTENIVKFIDLMKESGLSVTETYMKHPAPLTRSYMVSSKLGIQAINIGLSIQGLRAIRESIPVDHFAQFKDIVKTVFTKFTLD